MRCPVCSAEASEGASFCPSCGGKLPFLDSDSGKPTPADDLPTRAGEQAAAAEQPAPSSTSAGRGRMADVPEATLWEGTFSPKAMIGTYILCAILTIALLLIAVVYAEGTWRLLLLGAVVVVWIVAFVRLAVQRLGVSYKLTNQMFYHRKGLLTRTTDRIELIEIHDVTWQQGLIQRMVNVGTIIIDSSDRTHHRLGLPGIENVEDVAKHIDKARRGEQVRRGRRIESIGVQDG